VSSEHAPEEMGMGKPYEIQYILNYTDCGSLKRKQTVRAWLEKFNILIDDEFFIKWNEAMFKLIAAVKQYEGKEFVTDNAMEMMWGSIFLALYSNYDTGKEFLPQFENNVAKILSIFDSLETAF
jgi:hypothetical protein